MDSQSPMVFNSDSPLHVAVRQGRLEDVRTISFQQQVDVNVLNSKHETPLHLACSQRDSAIVQLLIAFGADPYIKDSNDKSAFGRSNYDIGTLMNKLLFSNGFWINSPTQTDGDTPLHTAVRLGRLDDVQRITNKQLIDVNDVNVAHETPIHLACEHDHKQILHILTSNGGCLYIRDCYNNAAIHRAVSQGHIDVVNYLITDHDCACDPKIKGYQGRTLLHYACGVGNVDLVNILIEKYGISPMAADAVNQTPLHIAASHGQEEIVYLLITKYNCPVDCRSNDKFSPLHLASYCGHVSVANLLVLKYKADVNALDEAGSTPFLKATMGGNLKLVEIMITDFDIDPLSVSDDSGHTPLHIACWGGHEELARLLITKYNCPVDVINKNKLTPLHGACSFGHSPVVRMLVSEFKANLMERDHENDTPVNKAALCGHADTIQMLITEFGCDPQIKGFEGRSLLHQACNNGNVLTAKELIKESPSLIYSVDDNGDSPLHFSSIIGEPECVRLLLFEYHAPVFIRNKAGKTALDLAKDEYIKKTFKEYMSSEHKSIQQEYEKFQALSLQKYPGDKIIIRIFVLGNPGSGKSTLVESLKRKGFMSFFFNVPEADVPLHTAGIVPSMYQSNVELFLYYDFAGDGEYYSSHAAILEMVSCSSVGTSVYLIVANLTKDAEIICNEIGYWLSFISYHCRTLDFQCKLKVIVVLSHSDCLNEADTTSKLENVKQYLHTHKQGIDIINVISSNCRYPRSSRIVESTLQQISKSTPPCSLSFKTTLLHGLLEKDFGNVIACKFQDLLIHIKDTGIQSLPNIADALYPIVKELHDIGLLMLIGQIEDKLENYLLLLKPSSLTNEVHQKLFSDSAMQNIISCISPTYVNLGIIPESYLVNVLPEHITKECLVQLQYCQEFNQAEVETITPDSVSSNNLLYFPALCKLDSEQSNWPSDPQLNFSIGWYTKCTGKFDYFPTRFLHVLLLRLAFAFALPIANCNITESNEISAHNRRCTMWKNGIRWLMEEGVECIFEMVNDNKGIVVITKSKKNSKEWATILTKIIDKVMQAKAEFCNTVSLHHFLLKSDKTSSFKNIDNLFEIAEVEKVIREGKKMVVSVSGRAFLDSLHLFIFRKYTFWGRYIYKNYYAGRKS